MEDQEQLLLGAGLGLVELEQVGGVNTIQQVPK